MGLTFSLVSGREGTFNSFPDSRKPDKTHKNTPQKPYTLSIPFRIPVPDSSLPRASRALSGLLGLSIPFRIPAYVRIYNRPLSEQAFNSFPDSRRLGWDEKNEDECFQFLSGFQ